MNSTLNVNNQVYAGAVKTALSVIYHLDDAGCTVLGISVVARNPVITISPPPADCAALQGATRVRRTQGSTSHSLMSAFFHGAQVEWMVRSDLIERTREVTCAHA
jgi:hypothetical protein